MKLVYKLMKSLVPCVLLTLCIGFCYAFSLFTPHIAEAIGCSVKAVGFTFCLNIFFLGMGAATFGPLVEKRIKVATLVSSILLCLGLVLGGIACKIGSIALMYVGCGLFCGLAEGAGYVAPNKNMLLWFPASNKKGVLSAISIFTFGLGSALCSWLFGILFPKFGIAWTFFMLALIYAVPSLLSAFLIDKPIYALIKIQKKKKSDFSYIQRLKDRFFQLSWLYMFLNISMGLILIGSCAAILKDMGLSGKAVIFTMMMCGIANGAGRLAFPAMSDKFLSGARALMFFFIVALEILLMVPVLTHYFFAAPVASAIAVVLIHSCYGAAFACLPSILSAHYGKDTLSQTHGFCLTSWGTASLMAYLCSSFVLGMFPGFLYVMILVGAGYVLNVGVSLWLYRISQKR